MKKSHSILLLALVSQFFGYGFCADTPDPSNTTDWPQWRGPAANGVADGRDLATNWSKTNNVVWRVKLPGWGTSSPVVFGDRVFVTSVLVCFDGKTGVEQYRQRLGGNCNSSPIASDSRLYISNNDGTTFVIQAGREFHLQAKNDLGERITASPAITGDWLILRTDSQLFCFGRK